MTGIFYGSTTGTTRRLALRIASQMGIRSEHVFDVACAGSGRMPAYARLLLGSSTWGCGALQQDWIPFLPAVARLDLSGVQVALFGCGDSVVFPATFCNAIGLLYQALAPTGCSFAGAFDARDYAECDSLAFRGAQVLGLAVDERNEPHRTEPRLARWLEALAAARPQ